MPLTIPFSSIIEGVRARKDYGDLSGLKDSLRTIGSIHPIVLSQNPDNTYTLIAGGRRYRAMKELGVTELTHASVLTPGCLGFSFRADVPEDELREAELDENLHRLKPKWQEDCLLIEEVHRLKRAKHGTNKWGQAQTAELLGAGYGKSNVNTALKVAKLLRAQDKAILACENMDQALKTLMKRKEDEALAEMHRRVMPKATASPVSVPIIVGPGASTSSFLDSFNSPSLAPILVDLKPSVVPQSAPITTTQAIVIPLSSMFSCHDSILSDEPWPSVDHIVTDIPYGIDMDNLTNVDSVRDTHDVDQNVSMMPIFLRKAFAAVRPGGFCVFFYDLDHHEKLQLWAADAGWRVQRWPFIAAKTSSAKNSAAQYNTTKNYECAMFLRRDSHTVLHKPATTSWKAYDFKSERDLYSNPFAKPFELWKDIYDLIAFPGQSVLDPYCGEMSACRAAINCGLIPHGIEIDSSHYMRGLEHVKAAYALIHKSNVSFT